MRTSSETLLALKPMRDRYLDVVEACVTGSMYPQNYTPLKFPRGSWRAMLLAPIAALFRTKDFYLFRKTPPLDLSQGRPEYALTMIGRRGIANVRRCLENVLRDDVPGDFLEAGVWRGGTCIFAKAMLEAWSSDRAVWIADSFQGVPPPNPEKYPADAGDELHRDPVLAVSCEEVAHNFERFGLLDERVHFLRGWFRETLPSAPIGKLAVLRLDGDLYESTWDVLSNLYSKLSSGGYCIVDDYNDMPACTAAVTDFRTKQKITEEIRSIGEPGTGCYWRKS